MTNYKINSLQASILIVFIVVGSIFGTGIYIVINTAKVDAYLSIILEAIIGIVFLLLCMYIANYKPEYPINEKINLLFGKILGTIFNIIINLVFLSMAVILLFSLANFIVSQFLSQTPLALLTIVIGIALIYSVKNGIESITRSGVIILAINILLFTISILGLFNHIDLSNLKPILENGFKPSITASIMLLFINVLPIFLILIIPKQSLVNPKKYNKYLIFSYILAFIISIFMVVSTVATLGIYLAEILQYPEYIVLKKVSILGFLSRIENLISVQWILGSYLTMSLIIYYITSQFKRKKDKPNFISIIITTIIIVILASTIFPNNTIFNNFINHYYFYITGLLLFFYIIIPLKIMINKKN